MFQKMLSLVLAGLVVNLIGANAAYAVSKEEREARFAERVKKDIAKLGTGPGARVEVKLRDGRKLKGYVSEAGEDKFVLVDVRTGVATTLAYPQVIQAKGNNLSTGVKIAIVVSIILVVALIVGSKVG